MLKDLFQRLHLPHSHLSVLQQHRTRCQAVAGSVDYLLAAIETETASQ